MCPCSLEQPSLLFVNVFAFYSQKVPVWVIQFMVNSCWRWGSQVTVLGAAATKKNMASLVLQMHLGMKGLDLTPQ